MDKTDACQHCTVRGNFTKCLATECAVHDSWFVGQLQESIEAFKERLKAKEEKLIMWRNIASEYM